MFQVGEGVGEVAGAVVVDCVADGVLGLPDGLIVVTGVGVHAANVRVVRTAKAVAVGFFTASSFLTSKSLLEVPVSDTGVGESCGSWSGAVS